MHVPTRSAGLALAVLFGCSTSHAPATTPPSVGDDGGTVDAGRTFWRRDGGARDSGARKDAGPGERECDPGTRRWCCTPSYCGWDTQTCAPDGSWGPCVEATVTHDGLVDRPATDCGCRYFYWNEDCCEDQMDRDGDGHADCIIPSDHEPPTCESDGTLCSYCDTHTDCGGEADMCLFARDGYAFCSRDCETEPCPEGYTCETVGTSGGPVRQCAPVTLVC